ncbi:MAG: hypothetical protein A2W31_00785 [Planctomycetes bacterium RBG_16_64_10]|nr:MAG: hypothetical protein A2W31_00785 [Planctomycetes bacterium RBG_16_64_10]
MRLPFPVRAGLGGLVATLGFVAIAYLGLARVPAFYRQALEQDAQRARQAGQELGSRATVLWSAVRRFGPWQAQFTSEQINGYLAVDLVANPRQGIVDEFRDPRVAIRRDRLLVGFRWQARGISTVSSVELGVYLVEPNVVACRIFAARAGSLPIPLNRLLDAFRRWAAHMEIPLHWAQADGDPVALITLPAGNSDDRQIWLERLELVDGQVHLAGHTRPTVAASGPGRQRPDQAGPTGRVGMKAKRQRR